MATVPSDDGWLRTTPVDPDRFAAFHEIAASIRCTPSVVRKRVSRGLARLRASLRPELEEDEP
jgi:hypothetical protein